MFSSDFWNFTEVGASADAVSTDQVDSKIHESGEKVVEPENTVVC